MHHRLPSLTKTISFLALGTALAVMAAPSPIQERADRFLALANAGYQGLYRVNNEAQWLAVTDVTPVHDAAAETAAKASAAFNGNPALINEARELLTHRADLNELTVRQLNQLLLNAAEGPMTNPALVAARVEAETKQASILNSFEFKLDGKPITANDIDNKLDSSTNLDERRKIWEASKESGPALKPGLVALRDLRNGCARELGHHDYFALQVAAYGMKTEELVTTTFSRNSALSISSFIPGRNINWRKSIISRCRNVSQRIGLTIVGARNGVGWLTPRTLMTGSKGKQRNGSSKPQSSFIQGSVLRSCQQVSGQSQISIRSRPAIRGRRTLTLRAGTSISKTTSVRSKASSRTRAGSTPRTTSWDTVTTLWLTRGPRSLPSSAPARILVIMKAWES
jgi:hypothetical protein